MLIGENCVVSINYTLKNDSGAVMDESPEGEPLVYLHGAAGIIPGLENELTGKTAGAEFQVTIKPEEAYGEHQPHLIQQVPRSAFPEDMELAEGMQFQAQTEGGPMPVTITGVSDDLITVDGNHPLAGLTLHFTGSIADVRDATEEELQHGHVHGPGGHQH
jgi:FKBP-type peptidyl-prolyl cis-trans isomerase SlyD